MYACEDRCPERPEEGLRSSGTGVTGGYNAPKCGSSELSWAPLLEWYMLSTMEPSFSPNL